MQTITASLILTVAAFVARGAAAAVPTSSLNISPISYLRQQSQCAGSAVATYRRNNISPTKPLCTSPKYPAIDWFALMGAWVHPPFALFSLADLPVDTINSVLQQAYDGSTTEQWWLYLASSSYDKTPKRSDEPKEGSAGTRTPLDKSFKFDFKGKTVKDAAQWLEQMPEDVALDSHHFVVLDKKASDGKVVLCRRGDKDLKGEEVTCILYDASQATLELGGLESSTWEELLEGLGKYEPEV